MKKKILAFVLSLVMMASTAIPSIQAASAEDPKPNLYVFDLESMINQLPDSTVQYDYLKFATALQGLANRTAPQIYYHFKTNSFAAGYGVDVYKRQDRAGLARRRGRRRRKPSDTAWYRIFHRRPERSETGRNRSSGCTMPDRGIRAPALRMGLSSCKCGKCPVRGSDSNISRRRSAEFPEGWRYGQRLSLIHI